MVEKGQEGEDFEKEVVKQEANDTKEGYQKKNHKKLINKKGNQRK